MLEGSPTSVIIFSDVKYPAADILKPSPITRPMEDLSIGTGSPLPRIRNQSSPQKNKQESDTWLLSGIFAI